MWDKSFPTGIPRGQPGKGGQKFRAVGHIVKDTRRKEVLHELIVMGLTVLILELCSAIR